MTTKLLFIGADHAGFSLKESVRAMLAQEFPSVTVQDCGAFDENSVDYPDIAQVVGGKVTAHASENALGVLICGSGIGMSIAANKVNGIRAAQVWDATSSRLSKEHNNSNIICFGSRLIGKETAFDLVRAWLNATFQNGRHSGRVEKINQLERK